MMSSSTRAEPPSNRRGAATRTCGITRTQHPKDTLLRMCLDPEGCPRFDVIGRAPGRGVYVQPDRPVVELALTAKGLGQLFRGKASVPSPEAAAELIGETTRRLEERVVEQLGLATRAGVLVLGASDVIDAAEHLAFTILARDVSARSSESVARAVPEDRRAMVGTKATLGARWGKQELGVVGIHPSVFAQRIAEDAKRLQRLTNERPGPEGACH